MKLVLGDMPIKDLTPKTTNIGGRIVKNMRICGSGIYTYSIQEADLLGLLPIPKEFEGLKWINVFRPADVLINSKDKFARVPIITGHHVVVDRENSMDLVVGMVGDSVNYEKDAKDGETYLYTTGTITAEKGVEAYEKFGQLSVGYDPIIEWEKGEHNGVPYHAVLKGFKDINHLLICECARGGPQCMVMDSLDNASPLEKFINNHKGVKYMGVFSKIFGSKTKPLAGDSRLVSELIQSIAVGADPETQVKKIKEIVGDSNVEFIGYLDELAKAKGESQENIQKAVGIVDEFYKTTVIGDEKACEKCGKTPCECGKAGDEKKPEEEPKKEEGDEKPEDDKKEEAGDGCGEGKPAGDEKKPEGEPKEAAGDAFDFDKLAEKVVEKIESKKAQTADLDMPLAGDSSKKEDAVEAYMKDVFGGR